MKKRMLIVLLSLVCALCLAFGLTACNKGTTGGGTSGGTEQSGTEQSGTEQSGTEQDGTEQGDSEQGDDEQDGDTEQGDDEQGGETTCTHTLVKTEAAAATCEKEGNIEYWICSDCGKYFSDGNGTTEITLADTVISATGHKATKIDAVTATCSTAGNTEYWYCSACDKYFSDEECTKEITLADTEISKIEHIPAKAVKENEVDATCGSDGSYNNVVYCSICGEKISSETITIEATGKHTYNNSWACSVCSYSEVTVSEGLAYTLSSDGTYYTVSGIGECTDTIIVIPYTYNDTPVTAIAASAFKDQTQLTSVNVPDSVASIDAGAFSGCSSLVSMTLPFVGGSVKTESDTYQYPFGYIFGETSYADGTKTTQYYYGLSTSSTTSTTYYIPTSLTTVTITGGNILYGAFRNCTSLTSITIPDSVTTIGNYAFHYCSSLTSITIPDGVTSIGNYTFRNCTSLTSITIPDSVTTIGNYAFYNCTSLTSITIPDSVTSIDEYVFYNCTSLESVTIGGSVTSIGYDAFYGCTSLKNVTIPDSVTSIGEYAFYGCTSLESITIPDSVISIGSAAFSGCSSLVSMTLPFVGGSASATSELSSTLFGYIFGTSSYTGSTSTKQYYGSVSFACYATYYIPTTLTTVTITGGDILYGAFYNCNLLTSITISNSVAYIGEYAFYYCKSLTSVTIPDSVTSIGNFAFSNCTSLTSVTIPNSVTSIGNFAFSGCTSLTSIIIPNSVISIGGSAFHYCTSLTSVIV